jgi:DNA modification methylase
MSALDLSEVPLKPYFKDEHCVIYNADCRKVLPFLPKFDLLLTDPPYGIGAGKMSFGMWRTSKMEKADWDKSAPPEWLLSYMLESAEKHIVWGGNYYGLPPSRFYLVWDKGAGFRGRDFAECEQAWCSWDGNAKVYQRDPLASGDYRDKVHPTQKPAALMKWCISLSDGNTVLDPFMGSGTTLVASKLEGRFSVGIEINEKYCESAAKRLEQGVLF